jgi:hypothetical protein
MKMELDASVVGYNEDFLVTGTDTSKCLLGHVAAETLMKPYVLRLDGCVLHGMIGQSAIGGQRRHGAGEIDGRPESKFQHGPRRCNLGETGALYENVVGLLSGSVRRTVVQIPVPVVERLRAVSCLDDVDVVRSFVHGSSAAKKRKRQRGSEEL